MADPILIGGNGHSGTRIFAEILAAADVNMGISGITRASSSFDLNIRELLNRWVGPYLHGKLSEHQLQLMAKQLRLRLAVYFPFRRRAWGFKNPRSMLILPFYHQLFPDMRFIHVIRDGRDVTLGNVLAGNEDYISAFMKSEDTHRSPEERMILFWGRSNERAQRYGERCLGARYLRVRFEDLCERPAEIGSEILRFAGLQQSRLSQIVRLVRKPTSIGRWRSFDPSLVDKVQRAGAPWLEGFGYEGVES